MENLPSTRKTFGGKLLFRRFGFGAAFFAGGILAVVKTLEDGRELFDNIGQMEMLFVQFLVAVFA
jgi:hypothetical protein